MTRLKPTLRSMHAVHSLTQAPVETWCQIAMGWRARPSLSSDDLCLVHSSAPQAIDRAREAESLTVSLDQGLLLAATRDAMPGVTGELVWGCPGGHAQCVTLYVHPVLLVRGASERLQPERVEADILLPSPPTLMHMAT
jgi:hypothetical protein